VIDTVAVTRYVTPLREGGSLPGLVEADDLGTYVCKFRGAGQGRKALVAEVVCAGLARGLGLPVPDLVAVDVDPVLAAGEPDQEVQDLLRASVGNNLGMDYLPGSLGLDAAVDPVDPSFAARVVWFDALVQNVDRSWHNPNLLRWHGSPWLIDHGAALYFHHSWPSHASDPERFARQSFDASRHVLLEVADDPAPMHDNLAVIVMDALHNGALDLVPDEWLESTEDMPDAEAVRSAYRMSMLARLDNPSGWLPRMGSS